ncbi:hypothetical protein BDB00DRAFT_829191 [Zychaea mexicana]|uniref:uncharacterized protein n=1 Tax=Zychaea mexicana TaxID=64656 RepID=UPI0022FF215C|nr:uncharacterized protein BDB00DRAFT_829191 [Zychaea mexicana]KAI9492295.1 hypothetical protein BDB00DRAFT_829191 [Zychaea mexicana]
MAWHSTATPTISTAAITTKTTFIFYLLYYLISAPPSSLVNGQLESDGCLKLTSSEACPAFSQYYVGLSDDLKSAYSFLTNVNDVASFDDALYNHVGSSSFLQQFGCSKNNNTQNNDDDETTYYPRYSLSRLCASFVHDATGSLSCNYGRGITPEPLCQSTCNDWVDSLENITTTSGSSSSSDASSFTCPSSIYGSFTLECSSWPAYTGTNGSCVLGSENEPDNCGKYQSFTHIVLCVVYIF